MRLDNIENFYPLSPLQQGLLFHCLSAPEARMFYNQMTATLQGNLNIGAFKKAWQRVVDHHPVLRTFFVWDGVKEPIQVVERNAEIPFAHYDWRQMSATERQEKLEEIRRADLEQGFDLAKAPLLRVVLMQTTDENHELLWSFHHLLMDGWSMFHVLKEVFALYEAFVKGEDLQLARCRPYRDYVAWLRRQSLPPAEAFWRKTLQGFTAPTPLVVDRVRESKMPDKDEEFDSRIFSLSAQTTRALETMSQRHHLTLNTVMQGAWALLLSAYSGEDDIVFGTIVSGRPAELAGVESMVGLFINTLPVRAQRPPQEPLRAWLEKFQTRQAEMREYEYSPLLEVQSWSDVPRGVSLFESIFMFENYRKDAPLEKMSAALEIGNVRWFERQNYPLAALAIPGERMTLRLTYHTGRFAAETIARMLGHWQALLEEMIANPTCRLADLQFLTPAERRQLLVAWNETQLEYSRERCAHELFEAQAAQRPEALAVTHNGHALTYHELNRRANQLAHHLRGLGIGPETLVGICLERSTEMIVAILGVLKAGGAFVPMDPAYPRERLAFMLQDAQAPVLLTKKSIYENFQFSVLNLKLICLDADWQNINSESKTNFQSGVTSENLAYVIYTSGSTGRPKGVEIPHSGLLNLIAWHQQVYNVTLSDRATQVAAPAFDASVWEVWPYLTTGASLHIPDVETLASPAKLLEWLAEQAITISFLPTPVAEAILEEPLVLCEDEGRPGHLALRMLLVGGDKLHRRPRQKLAFELANNYGPTENTVVTTWTPVPVGTTSEAAPPIGRPVANTQLYILDKYLRPVPIGVPGELHISGDSLARGYLRRPDLAAEKFIPNPFASPLAPHSSPFALRLYKTGDLVLYLPNGDIEFLGRIDHQVKIRGNRIELGEIEMQLLQHPAVREAVCVVNDGGAGKKRIVSYVVSQQNVSLALDDLRNFLKDKLPDYMIPSAFVRLEALPLTPNGKVDRQALPAPEARQPAREGDFIAPRNAMEKTLAEIWAQVLGVEKAGVEDNFFELGGDSILSLQIIAQANRAGIRFSPKQLFMHPTIAGLAEIADTAQVARAEQDLVTGALPLTPIQQWFFAQNFSEPQHWNMAMLLELRQALNPTLLESALHHLLAHHDALRLRFVRDASGWQASHAALDNTALLSRLDLAALSEVEQTAAMQTAAAELHAGLNLSAGPLLRAAHFDCGAQRASRLLIVAHHLVIDGVSWRILLEDLQAIYQQLSRGEKIQLPAKTTSFKLWAQKLREHAPSEIARRELGFWLAQHPAATPCLPVDFSQDKISNTIGTARAISIALSAAETRALLQETPKAYRTQIDDVLLAALAQTFSHWTGQPALFINLEGHGREDIFSEVNLSRTVGWFTTMFPVLLNFAETNGPGEILKSSKEQLRRIPNRGLGFGLLCYLSANSPLSSLPQPEVSFNYLGQFDQGASPALFKMLQEESGPACNAQAKRAHLLEITGAIIHDRLHVEWMYSEQVHRRATAENLAKDFMDSLRALIAHCQAVETGGYTPSDFPAAKLNQKDLDKLLGKISK